MKRFLEVSFVPAPWKVATDFGYLPISGRLMKPPFRHIPQALDYLMAHLISLVRRAYFWKKYEVSTGDFADYFTLQHNSGNFHDAGLIDRNYGACIRCMRYR